jgi:hypothetical protein
VLAPSLSRPASGGTIAAGTTLAVPVRAPVQLGNKGGIITLLDDRDLKVDGVS